MFYLASSPRPMSSTWQHPITTHIPASNRILQRAEHRWSWRKGRVVCRAVCSSVRFALGSFDFRFRTCIGGYTTRTCGIRCHPEQQQQCICQRQSPLAVPSCLVPCRGCGVQPTGGSIAGRIRAALTAEKHDGKRVCSLSSDDLEASCMERQSTRSPAPQASPLRSLRE